MLTWNRCRLGFVVVALAGFPAIALGDDAPKPSTPPAAKPNKAFEPIELLVSPSPAPVPALKYRLLPMESERNPGDAAPIYIRLGLGLNDADRKELVEKTTAWLDLPRDQVPIAEAHKLLDKWSAKLQQLAFGARRQTCHWNYTLNEQKEDVISVLMPDASEMRNWVRLQAIKARVEIAEKKYVDAVRSVETGIAFGRHAGEGPFLISTLVGVSCSHVMLAELDGLVAQPDSPNLYWALSALPSPLVSDRAAMENEQKLAEWIVPELNDLDRPRTDAEWSAHLGRLHSRLMYVQKNAVAENGAVIQVGEDVSLAEFRTKNLPEARTFFKDRGRSTEGMSDDQVLIVSIAERYREIRDDWYKVFYLPYSDARRYSTESGLPSKAPIKGPYALFAALMPTVLSVKIAATTPDRRIAALRVVEAIRMHAAKEGQLPGSLDDIKVVPVPIDPMTGKPFSYHKEGETVVLSGPAPAPNRPGITYRIRLRK